MSKKQLSANEKSVMQIKNLNASTYELYLKIKEKAEKKEMLQRVNDFIESQFVTIPQELITAAYKNLSAEELIALQVEHNNNGFAILRSLGTPAADFALERSINVLKDPRVSRTDLFYKVISYRVNHERSSSLNFYDIAELKTLYVKMLSFCPSDLDGELQQDCFNVLTEMEASLNHQLW